jgi:uncharacterized protein YjbI with pentapeptide repeats
MNHTRVWALCAILVAQSTVCQADIFRSDNGQLIPGTEGMTPGPGIDLSDRSLEFADLSEWVLDPQFGVIGLDLTGAQFTSSNLDQATFYFSNLANASFSGAQLTCVNFGFTALSDADLSGAIIAGANLGSTRGFTEEQLYSTASYQSKDLRGINLSRSFYPFGPFGWPGPVNDLTAWDFRGQNLTDANLSYSQLTNADFSGAVIAGAFLAQASGLTPEQIYATASYQSRDMRGIGLGSHNLAGWDLSGQNLDHADLQSASLANANLSGAKLTNVAFNLASVVNANLTGADLRGASGLSWSGAVARNAILEDGRIAGLNLNAGERLVIGNGDPATTVRVQGHLRMAEDSVLQLVFDADPWNSRVAFEFFDPGASVPLEGVLELAFAADVDVREQIGRTLQVFDWSGVPPSGLFQVSSPYDWDLSRLYTTGEVTLAAIPEPASAATLSCTGALLLSSRRRPAIRNAGNRLHQAWLIV